MNKGKTIFAQVMSLVNEYEFKKCVGRYRGDRHSIKFQSELIAEACLDRRVHKSIRFELKGESLRKKY